MISSLRKAVGTLTNVKPELHFKSDKTQSFLRFGEHLSGNLKVVFPKPLHTSSLVAKLEGLSLIRIVFHIQDLFESSTTFHTVTTPLNTTRNISFSNRKKCFTIPHKNANFFPNHTTFQSNSMYPAAFYLQSKPLIHLEIIK